MTIGKRFRMLQAALTLALILLPAAKGFTAQEPVVPVVDGRLGGCSAEFTVKGEDGAPVYDAKIDITIRYGFLGMRKVSLQVGTNSEGRARVVGLPDKRDRKLSFEVSRGALSRTVLMNTSDGCKAAFDVTLEEK